MVGVVRVAKLIITVFLDNYQLCRYNDQVGRGKY